MKLKHDLYIYIVKARLHNVMWGVKQLLRSNVAMREETASWAESIQSSLAK